MGRYEATDPQAVRMETSIRARLTVPGLSRRENQWLLGGRRILGCGSEPLRQVFPMSRDYRVLEWTFFEHVSEARSLSPLNPLTRRPGLLFSSFLKGSNPDGLRNDQPITTIASRRRQKFRTRELWTPLLQVLKVVLAP
jgi:hypothetical protein